MNPYQHGMAPHSAFARLMEPERAAVPGDGVQEHSKGALYPAVISVVESYRDEGEANAHVSLESRLRYRAFRLTLDGHSEDYAARPEAEAVARALLANPRERAAWRGHRDAAQ